MFVANLAKKHVGIGEIHISPIPFEFCHNLPDLSIVMNRKLVGHDVNKLAFSDMSVEVICIGARYWMRMVRNCL